MTKQLTAGQAASIIIDLIDDNGTTVDATAVSWTLYDVAGVQIATGNATGFTAGDITATIDLTAPQTAITSPMGAREIVLSCVTTTDTAEVRESLLVVATAPLAVAINSFQSLTETVLTRAEFARLDAWDGATRNEQMAAMQEAHRRVLRVQLQLPKSHLTEASQLWPRRRVNLARLSATEFASLPDYFTKAVKRAQLAEANSLLEINTIEAKRREGLVSETIGESSMFLNSKPYLNLAVSKAAYEELKPFVVFIVGIGRS